MVNRVYLIMKILGLLILVFTWKTFTWRGFLSGFPIAAVLAGSYFWIRLDIWRTNETIDELCNSGSSSNESLKRDLISRRVDSRAAIALLLVAAVVQALSLWSMNGMFIFMFMLLELIPLVNYIARSVEKVQLEKILGKE
jgi:hypothetical protein